MKTKKIYSIIGVPIILIVLMIIYAYNSPKQNEPKKLSLVEFNKRVSANHYVLVYFNASWCNVCGKMKPIIDEVETENKTIKVFRINTDDNKEIADEFEINSLPVLVLYNKGNIVWTKIGVISSAELNAKLDYLK